MPEYRWRMQARAQHDTPGAVDVSPGGHGAWRQFKWFGPVFTSKLDAAFWSDDTYKGQFPRGVLSGSKLSCSIETYEEVKVTKAEFKVRACYSDTDGVIHSSMEAAIVAQEAIERKNNPVNLLAKALATERHELVRQQMRLHRTYQLTEDDHVSILTAALERTGFVVSNPNA